MIDPGKQAELDQAYTNLGETLSSLWWAIYHRCVDIGFTEDQAMNLLQAYIMSTPFSEEAEGD